MACTSNQVWTQVFQQIYIISTFVRLEYIQPCKFDFCLEVQKVFPCISVLKSKTISLFCNRKKRLTYMASKAKTMSPSISSYYSFQQLLAIDCLWICNIIARVGLIDIGPRQMRNRSKSESQWFLLQIGNWWTWDTIPSQQTSTYIPSKQRSWCEHEKTWAIKQKLYLVNFL